MDDRGQTVELWEVTLFEQVCPRHCGPGSGILIDVDIGLDLCLVLDLYVAQLVRSVAICC